MAEKRGSLRDQVADVHAVLAELADGQWRTSRDFAPGSRAWIVGAVLTLLLRRGLVEREAPAGGRSWGGPRWRYRITAAGRAELAR